MSKDYSDLEGWSLQQPAVRRKFQKLRNVQTLREAKQKQKENKKYPQAGRCNSCGKDYERVNPVKLSICRRCAVRIREISGFRIVNGRAIPRAPISRHPNITKETCYLCGAEREDYIYATNCEICDKCVGIVSKNVS